MVRFANMTSADMKSICEEAGIDFAEFISEDDIVDANAAKLAVTRARGILKSRAMRARKRQRRDEVLRSAENTLVFPVEFDSESFPARHVRVLKHRTWEYVFKSISEDEKANFRFEICVETPDGSGQLMWLTPDPEETVSKCEGIRAKLLSEKKPAGSA